MASHPRPVMEASAIAPQNSSIILIPCFLNPIYISPAPGIREKINTQKPCFCFFIYLLASVYNFILLITLFLRADRDVRPYIFDNFYFSFFILQVTLKTPTNTLKYLFPTVLILLMQFRIVLYLELFHAIQLDFP